MSSGEGSVSRWLDPLRAGDPAAAQQLWERYIDRLLDVAQQKLRAAPRQQDAEDVVLSAFHSLCDGARRGRFPELADRDGLWRLLVVITARKVAHHRRDASRQKRGGDRIGVQLENENGGNDLEQLLSREPTPAFAAQAAEECRRLLRLLGDPELESIALRKMEGYTIEEIGREMGYVPRTIKRKVALIRTLWEKEVTR
jgi:RNA polymerase sigma factor (sigma-70 family)